MDGRRRARRPSTVLLLRGHDMNLLSNLSTAKRVILLMALLGVLSAVAGIALAKSGPSAPSITAYPPNPTASTSAAFSFSSSQSAVTFLCSLDGSAYTACSSPTSYTALTSGSHTFAVEARDASGNTSSATSYSWIIDTAPPTLAITFPAQNGSYNSAGWTGRCGQATGACGTVSDTSGVSAVQVSIRQNASGRYWTGSSFTATAETYLTTSLSKGAWFYALPTPTPDGAYTLHLRATDSLGNATPQASPSAASFSILTAKPPTPSITSSPTSPTTTTSASFSFSDSAAAVSFTCQLDGGKSQPCESPATYAGLSAGTHTFTVTATDAAGNVSSAASDSWQIVQQTNKSFTISGSVPTPLYPGAAAQPVPLTLSNPNNSAIYVTTISVSVQGTSAAGCSAAWFQVNQLSIPTASPIAVPAGGSTSLAGVAAPSIQMLDSKTNQDACKGATLSLSYAGTAHS
jgi:hypothetical protein